jgi:hypothetical protein
MVVIRRIQNVVLSTSLVNMVDISSGCGRIIRVPDMEDIC